MSDFTVVHNTFVVQREYPSAPERVFAAFSDPAKKRRWFAEGEHHFVEKFEMDFRVGGIERAHSRFHPGTMFPGVALVTEGIYLDIVPERRIVIASQMTMGDRRISASLVTIEIRPKPSGSSLVLTHQGAFFEGSDGPQLREAGWRKIAERLAEELARG